MKEKNYFHLLADQMVEARIGLEQNITIQTADGEPAIITVKSNNPKLCSVDHYIQNETLTALEHVGGKEI